MTDRANSRFRSGQPTNEVGRSIGGGIVADEDFQTRIRLPAYRFQALEQIASPVERRDGDGHQGIHRAVSGRHRHPALVARRSVLAASTRSAAVRPAIHTTGTTRMATTASAATNAIGEVDPVRNSTQRRASAKTAVTVATPTDGATHRT